MVVRDAPVLVTERLELWVPGRDDIAPMLAIVDDPETGRFLGGEPSRADHFARFSRNAGSWLLYGYGSFMLRERGSGELIGNAGVFHSLRGLGEDFDDSPEAGWILRADRIGQGLAHEAMTAALAWFERTHGRRRIVCITAPDNAPSIRLAERLGFAALRDAALPDGGPVRLFERVPGS
jgi:RimJ/RimL family protein N-acetyltransferase